MILFYAVGNATLRRPYAPPISKALGLLFDGIIESLDEYEICLSLGIIENCFASWSN